MNNKNNFKNAFTLIELLAVIIILGILMIIAIPSVTSYINNSRKSAYVDSAKEIIAGARNFVNEGKVEMYDTSTTYYIDYGCVKTENTSKSPYGDFVNAYVVVTYDGKGYTYYWTSVDETGQGVKIITKADELDEDDIVSDIGASEVAANVALGDTTSTTYINSSCQKQTGEIPVKYASTTGETSFTLTYNNQEGSGCTEQVGEYKKTWGTLCIPTKEGGVSFLGWFTQPNGGGVEVISSSIVNGNTTVYAKWGIPAVCKRATSLHTATCNRTSDGCYAAGYTTSGSKGTTTITYGNLGTGETLTPGDAFDCDVNQDGTYNAATERFYYVTDEGNNAVLIYYTNVTGGTTPTQNKYAYDSSNQNYHGPRTLLAQLPSTTQWSNNQLIAPGTRQITTQTGATTTNNGRNAIESFTYTDKAARLLTYQEVQASCGSSITSTGNLDNCNYLMENVGQYETTSGTYGYWLESPHASLSFTAWGVNYNRYVGNYNTADSSSVGVRPAITVLKSNIEY